MPRVRLCWGMAKLSFPGPSSDPRTLTLAIVGLPWTSVSAFSYHLGIRHKDEGGGVPYVARLNAKLRSALGVFPGTTERERR
jgi:hypothetical protein